VATSLNGRSVLFVQPYTATYRVPFFEELRRQLLDRGASLDLLVGQALGKHAARGDTVALPWATTVPSRLLTVAGKHLRLKALWRGARPDLTVLPHGSGWVDNYGYLLKRWDVALWGQGKNFVTDGHAVDRALEAWQLRSARHYFAYTEAGGRAVTEAGVPRDRVTVVRNTVDTRALRAAVQAADAGATAAELGVDPRWTALFVGGLDAAKRLDVLIEAADLVAADVPAFTLLVAGDGVEAPLVRAAVRTRPHVRYVGPADEVRKAALASVAQLIMMPGRVGLVAVDSFALGLPVVTTAWSQHAPEFDYLTDATSVVAPDDVRSYAEAVAGLLQDPDRTARLRRACWASMEEYSVESMAARFVDGIATTLQASRAGR
jgi:glycosyltransferase involved in cell wall biosynthesis